MARHPDLYPMATIPRSTLLTLGLLLGMMAAAQPDTATIHIVRSNCDVMLTVERLRALTLREVTVTERDGINATYQGAWLGEVLDRGCDSTARLDKHGALRAVVKITATDGFTAVVAMAEAVEASAHSRCCSPGAAMGSR